MPDLIKIVVMTMVLLPSVFAQDTLSQQKSNGIGLFNTAQKMMQQAKTTTDREKAAEKFLEALQSFEREGFLKGQGAACDYIAVIYEQLGKSGESLKYHKRALEIKSSTADLAGQANTLHNLAMLQIRIKNYSDAEKSLNKALKIIQRNSDRKGAAQIELNLGIVQRLMGQTGNSLRTLDKAAVVSKANNDARTFAETLLNRGKTRIVLGDYAEAQKDFEAALRNGTSVPDPCFRMEATGRLGQVLAEQGLFPDSKNKLTEALKLSERCPNRESKANILAVLALTARDLGQYDEAHNAGAEALTLFKELGDERNAAEAINSIGGIYLLQGRYPEAVRKYLDAARIASKCRDKRIEARTLHNLAAAYMDSGDFKLAKANLDAALKINEEIPDVVGQAKNLGSLANMYHAQGFYEPAQKNYLLAIERLQQKGDYRYRSRLLNNLGAVYQDQGEYDKAEEKYKESLKIAADGKSEMPKDRIWNNLANLYMDKISIDKEWQRKARENVVKLEQSDLYQIKGGANSSVGRFYYLTGHNQKAKKCYEDLLKTTEKSGDIDDFVGACTGLGLVYEAEKNYPDAEKYFKRAIDETENIRKSLVPLESPEFFNVTSRGFSRITPYKGLVRVLLKEDKKKESLEASEYTKARNFAEEMRGRTYVSGFGLPKDLKEKDDRLSDARRNAYRSMLSSRRSGDEESTKSAKIKVAQIDQLLKEHRKTLLDSPNEKSKLFALTKYPEPLPLQNMALKDNEWTLVYDVMDTGVTIYFIRGKKLDKTIFKAINKDELGQLIADFMKAQTNNSKQFGFSAGKRLGDLLLGEILDELPAGQPITIIPDGSLQAIPFEALVLNDRGEIKINNEQGYSAGATFFADRNPISYYQSLTTLTLARQNRLTDAARDRILVMADPYFGPKENSGTGGRMTTVEEAEGDCLPPAKRLAKTSILANALSNVFENHPIDVYQRHEASKDRLLKKIGPNLDQYESIVFATHGFFSRNNASIREPILLLAAQPYCKDGYLYSHDVQNLRINADIVALTACQTGLGKDVSGEGVMSMGRAFQYAGAKSVLMTLWNVAEDSSVKLTENFFQHRKAGKSKLESLKLARDEIRKQGFEHPYFWAAFILVGEAS